MSDAAKEKRGRRCWKWWWLGVRLFDPGSRAPYSYSELPSNLLAEIILR